MFRSLSFKKFQGPVEKLERICKETGKAEKLDILFEKYPDCRGSINTIRFGGCTPLHEAVKNNFIEVVKYLVEKTLVDVNARVDVSSAARTEQTPCQLTALHLAILNEKPPIVNVLLASDRIDVNVVDEWNETPLHIACDRGYLRLAKKLLAVGASVIDRNKNGLTPLLIAASHGHTSVVSYLLENSSSNVNEVDLTNSTALHHACREDHLETASYLVLNGGADLSIRNSSGKAPVDVCIPGSKIRELIESQDFKSEVEMAKGDCDSLEKMPVHVMPDSVEFPEDIDNIEVVLDSSNSSPHWDQANESGSSVTQDKPALNKSREGRVSFRTQSTENITYPGLLPEPLPPLPPTSGLLRTLSYTKPRKKSASGVGNPPSEIDVPSVDQVDTSNGGNLENLTSKSSISQLFPSADVVVTEVSSPTATLKRRSSATDIPVVNPDGKVQGVVSNSGAPITETVVKGSVKRTVPNLTLDTNNDSALLEATIRALKLSKKVGYELRDAFGPIGNIDNGISPDVQSDASSFDFDHADSLIPRSHSTSVDDQDYDGKENDIEIILVLGLELSFSPHGNTPVFLGVDADNRLIGVSSGRQDDRQTLHYSASSENIHLSSQSSDDLGAMSFDKVFEATNNKAHCLVSDFDDVSPMQTAVKSKDHAHSYLDDVGVSLTNADAVAILSSHPEFEDHDDVDEPASPSRYIKPIISRNSEYCKEIEFFSFTGRFEGKLRFWRLCRAFFIWKDMIPNEKIDEDDQLDIIEFKSDSISLDRADRQYLTTVLSTKLLALCEFYKRHYASGSAQLKLNAWHKLRTHRAVMDVDTIPPAVRVVLKLNERPLWSLFCNYISSRLDIPASKTDQAHHKKKLLSVQACWQLLKDFGVAPAMCRRHRLVELIAETIEIGSDRDVSCLQYDSQVLHSFSAGRKSTSPSRRKSFHYKDPTPRKPATPLQNMSTSTQSPHQNSPGFAARRSSLAPDEMSIKSRRRDSIIAKLFSPEALAEEKKAKSSTVTPQKPSPGKGKVGDSSNEGSNSAGLLNRLFGVSALSELKHPSSARGKCIDSSPSSSRSHSPTSPLRHSDPRSLFAKPPPKKVHGTPYLGEQMNTFTGPVLSFNDFNHLLWRLTVDGVEDAMLGPTSKSLHLLFVMDSSNGRLEMKRSCKYPEEIPPFILKELTSKARAKAILSHFY